MNHIKKFNEEIYLRGGEDKNGNPHHSTDTHPDHKHSNYGLRPELKEFLENINVEINELTTKQSLNNEELLFVEELHRMYKDRY